VCTFSHHLRSSRRTNLRGGFFSHHRKPCSEVTCLGLLASSWLNRLSNTFSRLFSTISSILPGSGSLLTAKKAQMQGACTSEPKATRRVGAMKGTKRSRRLTPQNHYLRPIALGNISTGTMESKFSGNTVLEFGGQAMSLKACYTVPCSGGALQGALLSRLALYRGPSWSWVPYHCP